MITIDRNVTIFRLPNAMYNFWMPQIVMCIILMTYLTLSISENINWIIFVVFMCIMILLWVIVVIYSYWMFKVNFVAISESGIEYRAPGIHIYARWNELDRIGQYNLISTSHRFNRTLTVIYLKNSVIEPIKYRHSNYRGKFPDQYLIPIGDFESHKQLQRSKIMKLILQYATQLN